MAGGDFAFNKEKRIESELNTLDSQLGGRLIIQGGGNNSVRAVQ